jgi:hypothetical protein
MKKTELAALAEWEVREPDGFLLYFEPRRPPRIPEASLHGVTAAPLQESPPHYRSSSASRLSISASNKGSNHVFNFDHPALRGIGFLPTNLHSMSCFHITSQVLRGWSAIHEA